jgi:hypothetical protein
MSFVYTYDAKEKPAITVGCCDRMRMFFWKHQRFPSVSEAVEIKEKWND